MSESLLVKNFDLQTCLVSMFFSCSHPFLRGWGRGGNKFWHLFRLHPHLPINLRKYTLPLPLGGDDEEGGGGVNLSLLDTCKRPFAQLSEPITDNLI